VDKAGEKPNHLGGAYPRATGCRLTEEQEGKKQNGECVEKAAHRAACWLTSVAISIRPHPTSSVQERSEVIVLKLTQLSERN
jgi:hypothetical protein